MRLLLRRVVSIVSKLRHRFSLYINPPSMSTISHRPRLSSSTSSSFSNSYLCSSTETPFSHLHFSTMVNGNGVAKNKGKRKVHELSPEPTEHQLNLFNLNAPHFLSPSVPLHGRHSQIHQILNNTSPSKPFSFMALLTAEDEDDDYNDDPLSKEIKEQRDQINQIISFHSNSLRLAMEGMLEKHRRNINGVAEERAGKRLKERELELQDKLARNEELERMVEHYRGDNQRLRIRVRNLERTETLLRERLQAANDAHRYAEAVEETESSYEDPDRVGPVRLDCKVCARQLATVMLWPCRHICVCTRCEATTRYCPVCSRITTTSVLVHLPIN